MARYSQAFGGQVNPHGAVDALAGYLLEFGSSILLCGAGIKVSAGRRMIWSKLVQATNRRQWRDVITDLACAVPDVEIQVHAVRNHSAACPSGDLRAMTGLIENPPHPACARMAEPRPGSCANCERYVTDRGAKTLASCQRAKAAGTRSTGIRSWPCAKPMQMICSGCVRVRMAWRH